MTRKYTVILPMTFSICHNYGNVIGGGGCRVKFRWTNAPMRIFTSAIKIKLSVLFAWWGQFFHQNQQLFQFFFCEYALSQWSSKNNLAEIVSELTNNSFILVLTAEVTIFIQVLIFTKKKPPLMTFLYSWLLLFHRQDNSIFSRHLSAKIQTHHVLTIARNGCTN